ncbi:MAG: SURF1 family protein [Gammaproteobacteria bacterium]|nr:SURF1 family protein [Gammaproteobacteria bacterium]
MVLLTPVFCGLGLWQLDRAEQKRNLAHTLEMRRKMPALTLDSNLTDFAKLEHRKIIARGRLLQDKTVLIENRKHQGRRGFHVITPLRLGETDQILLVNRGWIPLSGGAGQADVPTQDGSLLIEGVVNHPQPPALDLNLTIDPVEVLPSWPFLTLENYTAWSGLEILPLLILQAPDPTSGFVRQWPRPAANETMHIGYAIQWFAFALITLLIWLRLSLHKTTGEAS